LAEKLRLLRNRKPATPFAPVDIIMACERAGSIIGSLRMVDLHHIVLVVFKADAIIVVW